MSSSRPSGLCREHTLTRLIDHAERRRAWGRRLSQRYSHARMALFLTSAIAAVTCFKLEWYALGNGVIVGFILVFTVVAGYHNRLERRMQRWAAWQSLKRAHVARLHRDWSCLRSRPHPLLPDHPYAHDLDLVGDHSLLRLLDTTVSSTGRERLASWFLIQPPDPDRWRHRQAMSRELSALPLFRDRLVLEGVLIGEQEVDGERLKAVLLTPAGWPALFPLLLSESALAIATAALLSARLAGWLAGDYWLLSFGVYAFVFLFTDRSAHSFEHALSLQGELHKLGAVLGYLERRAAALPHTLRERCKPLLAHEIRPSRHLKRAAAVVAGLSVRANPLAHVLINVPGPWDLWFTWRLRRLQGEIHAHLPVWLDILADVEAAGALGTFAWLHPAYAWPRMRPSETDQQSQPAGGLAASRLGHPLIAAPQRVANDLSLEGSGRILLVTGSNMSGKSTFLRTIGVNLCLAQAGAPVCAERFEFTWSRLGACIRVTDSIEAGLSHFYAEVKRLKALLDAALKRDAPPLLFLIDEIFRGTNNRERLIGSRAYIVALAATRALGLITTHDLELAELEKTIPTLTNVHFQETVEQGRLTFDYRLRPGPCPTTNALRIMALEGLPTENRPPGAG